MNISQLVSVLNLKCPIIKSEDFTGFWKDCGGVSDFEELLVITHWR